MQTDFFNISELLTQEQRLIAQAVKDFSDKEIKPIIDEYAQRAEFPKHLVAKFGDLGVLVQLFPKNTVAAAWIISVMG